MKLKNIILSVIVVIWTIAVGVGIVWVTDYTSRPGISAISPNKLPGNFSNQPETNLPKLLIFLHPHCPCGRATLAELARLTARNNNLEVYVFFYQPSDQSREWVETNIWRQASSFPNVQVATMSETEIQKFGAITSGQALLYDNQGNLVFSGGITRGRGHEGDNSGRESIENYLQTGKTTVSETSVFGCILTTPE